MQCLLKEKEMHSSGSGDQRKRFQAACHGGTMTAAAAAAAAAATASWVAPPRTSARANSSSVQAGSRNITAIIRK